MYYKLNADKKSIELLSSKFNIVKGWINTYIELDDMDNGIVTMQNLLGRIVVPDLDNHNSIIVY